MPSATELARTYAELIVRKERNQIEEGEVSAAMLLLEGQLVQAMADEGLQSVNLEKGANLKKGITLYRKTDRFYGPAEGVEKSMLIQELARHPQTMDLVSPGYNANSLRARMNEIKQNGESLPVELERLIRVTEKFRVGHRSS